jgi:hypothetical protein
MKRAFSDQHKNSHRNTHMRVDSGLFRSNYPGMRTLVLFLGFLAVTSLSTFAQDDNEYSDIQTIMGGNESVGGYGAISMQYTELENRDAFVFGARGGVIIGHVITLGLSGSGFFNDLHYDAVSGMDLSLAGGYGGFFFEPVVFPKFPVHVAFPILIGAGGVAVVSKDGSNDWNDYYNSQASDAFMVIEPGVEIELNVTRFFRFCIGGYYRYTSDINIEDPDFNVESDILRGFSGGVTFKFGRF